MASVAATAATASADADPQAPAQEAIGILPFELEASNGYTITGLAGTRSPAEPGALALFVDDGRSSVIYGFPAQVGEDSVSADLGALGRIDLKMELTGGTKSYRSACGEKTYEIPKAEYRGTISFRGERGFTRVEAESAPMNPQFELDLVCAGFSSLRASGEPGAELHARRRTKTGGAEGVTFEAITNGPREPVLVGASIREIHGEVSIVRSVREEVGTSAFDYRRGLRSATVEPPPPFDGSAAFGRGPRGRTWRGDLTVDFPGRPGVRLAGRGFQTGLSHASYELPEGASQRLSP